MVKLIPFVFIRISILLLISSAIFVNSTDQLRLSQEKKLEPLQIQPNLTIFYINDFQGRLEPRDGAGGAATLMGNFEKEGLIQNDDSFLLLSGGDQNTGPGLATLSKGEAVIDVMNAMGFSAAAIGHHEFDYGTEWLIKRQEMAEFPILSANIYDRGTQNLANFTIPWVIQEHNGINIGIIGLTTITTYNTGHPKITQYYDFGDYETAVRNNIIDLRDEGADLVIILAHVPPDELIQLSNAVSELDIPLFFGAHGGEPGIYDTGISQVVMAGHYNTQFVKMELFFNITDNSLDVLSVAFIDNVEGQVSPNQDIQVIIDDWKNIINVDEIVTYTSQDIFDDPPNSAIGNLVVDSFLYFFHNLGINYNFGITNRGGSFRDYYREGYITISDIISVTPFENNLLEMTLTGKELKDLVISKHNSYVFSGIKFDLENLENFEILVEDQFFEINENHEYTGVMTDYSWYIEYQNQIDVIDTHIDHRDAIISYYRSLDDLSNYDFENRYPENQIVKDPNMDVTSTLNLDIHFSWYIGVNILMIMIMIILVGYSKMKVNMNERNKVI